MLSAMLGKNRELAARFQSGGYEVVVVPANRPMTDLPEFSSLRGVPISQASGSLRTWDETRGVGGLEVPAVGKVYVAVTEENLLGGDVGPAVKAVGGGCYAHQYSTTSHEFAHLLHQRAMTPAQRSLITRSYRAKRAGVAIDNQHAEGPTILVTGSGRVSQRILDRIFDRLWTDGPRRKLQRLPRPMSYWVSQNGQWLQSSRGGWFEYVTRYELQDCYAAFDEFEYFAQVVNAYLGTNGGADPYTRRPRQNGEAWVRQHEPLELVQLLDELFAAGPTSGFGAAKLPQTNEDDGEDLITVRDIVRNRIDFVRFLKEVDAARQRQPDIRQSLTRAMAERRAGMGYD